MYFTNTTGWTGRKGRTGEQGRMGGKGGTGCHAANQATAADAFDVLLEFVSQFLADVAESMRGVNAVANFGQRCLRDVEKMQTRPTGTPGKSFHDIRRH
jgi:hypothetical protein